MSDIKVLYVLEQKLKKQLKTIRTLLLARCNAKKILEEGWPNDKITKGILKILEE